MSSPGYDTGVVVAGFDPAFGHVPLFLPSAVSRRHLQIDLSDGSLPHLQAGRLFAGAAFKPTHNLAIGYEPGFIDHGNQFQSESGNDYVSRGSVQRTVAFDLSAVTTAEWEASLEPMLRLSGSSADVLVCLDPASSNIGRDAYFGLLKRLPGWKRMAFGFGSSSFFLAHRI